jgi:rhodanese-related sulfurtransferase
VPIESMDPPDAHTAVQADDSCAFVDVRTCEEYERGHPVGAVNVPWAVLDPNTGQMAPNPGFMPTMQKHFDSGRKLYMSCQAGMRSMNACKQLEAAGYSNLVNVAGGFGGRRGPMGQVVTEGWADAGLPVESSESTYGELSRT